MTRVPQRPQKRKAYPLGNLAVGLGTVTCAGCSSKLTFAAQERPETCHMCGSAILPAETFNLQKMRAKRRSADFTTGYLRRALEPRDNRSSG